MRRTIVMAVLVLTTASTALGQSPRAKEDRRKSIEQVIRQLDHERIQAQIDADAAALERIYAADFIGVGPSGAVRTKPQVSRPLGSRRKFEGPEQYMPLCVRGGITCSVLPSNSARWTWAPSRPPLLA